MALAVACAPATIVATAGVQPERSSARMLWFVRSSSADRLNDLDGPAWVSHAVTVFDSRSGPWSALKKQHPATFSEDDAARLIRFFTRRGGLVLDPFAGTGSTLLAAAREGRRATGFELYEQWCAVACERTRSELDADAGEAARVAIHRGDHVVLTGELRPDSVDFVLTSPPYWSILKKIDKKVTEQRVNRGLGHEYGDDPLDVGRARSYGDYLADIEAAARGWLGVVRPGRYVCVIVGDFRHGPRFYMLHADVSVRLDRAGFTPSGLFVIVQPNRKAMLYGFPTAFVPQPVHMDAMIARKPRGRGHPGGAGSGSGPQPPRPGCRHAGADSARRRGGVARGAVGGCSAAGALARGRPELTLAVGYGREWHRAGGWSAVAGGSPSGRRL